MDATVTTTDLAGSVTGLDTAKGTTAAVEVDAKHNGGDLVTRGKLDLAASRYIGTC